MRYPGCSECSLAAASLSIRSGDRIALTGASGGGKTTLLRVLEGSLTPATGAIRRNGRVALIYQDLRLVAERTVLENICSGAFGELGPFGGLIRFPRHVRTRAEELQRDLGLARLSGRKVGSLSGGQRQRVAIARALIAHPRALLADEPLASLDRPNARRTLDLLACLQKKYGFALVLSTHAPDLIPGFFTRRLVVTDGHLAETPPDEIEEPIVMRPEICIPMPATESLEGTRLRADDPAAEDLLAGGMPAPGAQDRSLAPESPWSRTARRALATAVLLALLAWSVRALEMRGASFSGAFSGLAAFLASLIPASWGDAAQLPYARLAKSLLQTLQMALLGTAFGLVVSLPLAIVAARQMSPRWVRAPVRLFLNGIRTIPAIFWALLFVAFVGLGPVAGVFALAAYSMGYLTKFFYEALEDTDARPASALHALGASRVQAFAAAILPAARPALLGACLFVFEYNIRSASVLGVVGAGGIGQDLMYYIEWRQFPAAATGLLMILAVVVVLDTLSHYWRRRLTRQRGT